MLDTLLEIGRVLKESPDGLKHHRYMIKGPFGDEKKQIEFWTVPVNADGSFNMSHIKRLTDENILKQLYLLDFKTSEADSTKKYVFGDIYWFFDGNKESGNFFLGDPEKNQVNSFLRGRADAKNIDTSVISVFGKHLNARTSLIERYLRRKQRRTRQANEQKGTREAKQNCGVYLHFDFEGRHWYELEEMEKINEVFLQNFYQETPQGYVLIPYIYKTLIGDKKSPDSIPDFNTAGNKNYRARVFHAEERLSLIYAIKYSKRGVINKNDLKIVVLPRGKDITAPQIERFFDRQGLQNAESGEEEFRRGIEETTPEIEEQFQDVDELFARLPLDDEEYRNFTQFDFIFCNTAGKTEVDLIEISSLERSRLSHISQRVRSIRHQVEDLRHQYFLNFRNPPQYDFPLSITRSFLDILGDNTQAKKKYQNHLLKVLPQIYTESYFHDVILLPALIDKTEVSIRDRSPKFDFLKFDFYFLTLIQHQGDENLMDIQNSQSYHIGKLLGTLARPLRSKINSFDKNYAGLISRRVATLDDVLLLHNELNEKLIMHKRAGTAGMFSPQLTDAIKSFDRRQGRYDKNECAFGFFESYFAPSTKDDKDDDESQPNESA